VNPKIKLFIVVAVSTLTLALGWNPLYITPIFFLVLLSIFLFKVYKKLLGWLKFLVTVGLLIILIQTFTYSGFGFSFEGLTYGMTFSLRFLTLILLVFVFVHTTPTRRLVEAFSFLPYPLSFMLMLSLSLLPKIEDLAKTIVNAQKARGLNFKTLNIFKVYPPILIPLLSKTLEKSQQLALALQTRGFE
jgi:energy-coupling factor transport system permease protein